MIISPRIGIPMMNYLGSGLAPSQIPGLSSLFDATKQVYTDGAILFTASDKAYLSIVDASQTGLNPGTGDYSYSFWVKPTSLVGGNLLGKFGTAGYVFDYNATGLIEVIHRDAVGQVVGDSAAGVLTTGSWQNYTVVANRTGNLYVYKNGNTASPVITLDISSKQGSVSSTADFILAARSAGLYYDGSMDSLGFWNKALSAAEVTSLYNDGAGLIYSDTASTSLQTGMVSWYDFNEEGGIRYDSKGTNHLSQVFGNIIGMESTLGTELVTNGAFTTDTTGWTAGGSTLASVSGGQSGNALRVTNDGSNYGYAYQAFATTVNQNYTVSYYYKKGTADSAFLGIGVSAGAIDNYFGPYITDADWTLRTSNFKATATTTYMSLVNASNTNGQTNFWDTISIKPLTQTNLNGGFESLGTGETLGSELVQNPGFETAGGGGEDIWASWQENATGEGTLTNEGTVVHSGSHACKIEKTAGTAWYLPQVVQAVTVIASTRYKLTFWTRGDGSNSGTYALYDGTNAAYILDNTLTGVTGTTYTQVTKYFTTPVGCLSVSLFFAGGTTAGIYYFDDVSIKQVTASNTFLNWSDYAIGSSTINVETTAPYAGTNAARLDIDAAASLATLSYLSLTSGHKYKVSAYMKASSGTPSLGFVLGEGAEYSKTLTTSYALYEQNATCTSASTTFYFKPAGASKSYYIDNVTLVNTEIPATAGIAAGLAKDGNLCASFNDANYLTIADNASLRPGTSDLSVWAWVKFNTIDAAFDSILDKGALGGGTADDAGYWINNTPTAFGFQFAGPTGARLGAQVSLALQVNTWYFVLATIDRDGNATLYVNNVAGTPVDVSSLAGDAQGNVALVIGGYGNTAKLNGLVDGVGVFKRLLTSDERTALFNAGKGVKYAGLPSTVSSDATLVGFWNLDEYSAGTSNVTRLDSTANDNDLTSAGNVPSGQGVDYYEGSISKLYDQSGSGNTLTQTTLSARLLYRTNILNGKAVITGDGLTKFLSNAADLLGVGSISLNVILRLSGWGGGNAGRIISNGKFILYITNAGTVTVSSDGSTLATSAAGAISLNTTYNILVTRTSAGVVNIKISDVASGSADQASGTPAAGTPTILGNNSAMTAGLSADLAELEVYAGIITAAQATKLYNYEKSKWGAA